MHCTRYSTGLNTVRWMLQIYTELLVSMQIKLLYDYW